MCWYLSIIEPVAIFRNNLIDLCRWKEEYIRVLIAEQSWSHQGRVRNTFWVAVRGWEGGTEIEVSYCKKSLLGPLMVFYEMMVFQFISY